MRSWRQRKQAIIETNKIANMTSDRKCLPFIIRIAAPAADNIKAPENTIRRIVGLGMNWASTNADIANAVAPDASPDTNEQFVSHCSTNSNGGEKTRSPPNSAISFGLARPQCDFKMPLASNPGPRAYRMTMKAQTRAGTFPIVRFAKPAISIKSAKSPINKNAS